MTITIKDVAARAGVSAKTVSRVINGEAHVRQEVRETVTRVVAELDYRPNAFARGLSSSRSFLIGLFFDDPTTAYAAALQRGALTRSRELSHHLLIEQLDPARADWRGQLAATLKQIHLAGAILTPPICDIDEVIGMFRDHDVPLVRIAPGTALDTTPSVGMNDRAAAREMTELLLGQGHRDIAFIRGRATHYAAAHRWDGFSDAMAAAGLPVDPARVLQGELDFRSGFAAGEAILSTPPFPTAIFASNDEMALGVIVAAASRGIAVPDRLSVVGFDDAPIARMAWPPLSTIVQPNTEMADAAVEMLVGPTYQASRGEPGLRLELPYSLVVRSSSGPHRG